MEDRKQQLLQTTMSELKVCEIVESTHVFNRHDWITICDLKQCLQYNNKIGVITDLSKHHAVVSLMVLRQKIKVPFQNLHHLNLQFSYANCDRTPTLERTKDLAFKKSSKYTRLVHFLDHILQTQNHTPILIEENIPVCSGPVIFWKIPGISCGLRFIRLPQPSLIEALLARDINSLVKVVNYQNDYMSSAVEEFRDKIQNLLLITFPECKVIEAGSTSRKTNAMPISDLDIVCCFSSESKCNNISFDNFKNKLIKAIQEKQPDWNTKNKEIAIGIETNLGYVSNGREPELPMKLYADVVFKSPKEADAYDIANQRRDILSTVPPCALDAAKILKVILKCKMWPSVEHRPPSYMVDVVVKYMCEYGVPRVCNRVPVDPRPYIKTGRRCYMFWKEIRSNNKEATCIICQKSVNSGYWECPRCLTVVCSPKCKKQARNKLRIQNIQQQRKYKFPDKAYHSFSTVPASRHAEYNNRQWMDPRTWHFEHPKKSAYNLIIAFFHFGAYFNTMMVLFSQKYIKDGTKAPYIQDPANVTQNIIERFKPNSFIHFCQGFIDDSSKGFYVDNNLLDARKSFFNPFNTIFHVGNKITIFLRQIEYETNFECLVDPRWSYKRLLEMHNARDSTECPNVLFWDHTRASFIDHRGVVPDPSVSMLSRGVTFGHFIELVELNSETAELKDENQIRSFTTDDLVTVPLVEDHIDPEEIREPRYGWTSNTTHPKVLVDYETGAECHFSPSINVVRSLGPDFDGNPLNSPDYEGFIHFPMGNEKDTTHIRLYR